MGSSLGIVLKTIEVCNLNCSYCYFFNGIDTSFKQHPHAIQRDTIQAITDFLKQGIKDLNLTDITIGLHGGEPLLQRKKELDWMCQYFLDNLATDAAIDFSLQTNGVLLDKEWIDYMEKYSVDVGVSIDGPKAYHDKYRVDHKGRGSYDKVVEKIHFYHKEARKRGIKSVGALSVINPELNGRIAYRHFVEELKIKSFDFLFPDNTYDHPPAFAVEQYGKFMCAVLEEWTQDEDPTIKISFIASVLGIFYGKSSGLYGIGINDPASVPLITIASNGDLSPVDELRSTDPHMMHLNNVRNTSLKNFLQLPVFQEIKNAQQNLPALCQACCWEKVCGGSGIVNRFSTKNRFDNPSIYCEGLKIFYAQLVAYMLRKNFPKAKINQVLFP